jgi:hypothetical protein
MKKNHFEEIMKNYDERNFAKCGDEFAWNEL